MIGSSGSGKTTLIKDIVYSWLDEVPNVRFVVWDYSMEWGEPHPNLHRLDAREVTLEDAAGIALELGDCTLVADELDAECDSSRRLQRGENVHAIVNYGRHANVGLLWGVRSCMDIPRGLTRNTNVLFVLLTHEPSDLDWLDKKTGRDGTAARAQQLQPGEWFRWDATRRQQSEGSSP